MKKTPFLGNGIYSKSAVVTRQRRLNVYFETREDGDRTDVACYGTPGLVLSFTLSDIVRGILGTASDLYVVSSNTFYKIAANGSVLYSNPILTASGNVSMAANPTQVLLVDGLFGYLYSKTTGALGQVTSGGFPNGANTCTMVGGRFFAEQPGTQNVWASNGFDGTTWNALAFAAASLREGNIVAVDNLAGNLLTFSERHVQFWQDVGADPFPDVPILSATSEYGLEAIWCRSHIDNSIIYLAHNPQGTVQVARIVGINVEIISTNDLEQILNSWPTVTDMVSMVYVVNKHPMFQMSSPSQGRSFLYDCSQGIWSEVQTGAAVVARHLGNFSTFYAGYTLVTDYSNGNVYTLSDTAYTDNGTTIVHELITRHAMQEGNDFGISEVVMDMDTGVGINSGQGVDPQFSLEVSKDYGRTFGTPRVVSMGRMGDYRKRVYFRRFGMAKCFVFRLRHTDPTKFIVTNAFVTAAQRPQ